MKLHISREITELFRIESEKFGREAICLVPGWVEGAESKIWAMIDARTAQDPIVELKSGDMSIWVPERCVRELDGQVIVRGRSGFITGSITDLPLAQLVTFADSA